MNTPPGPASFSIRDFLTFGREYGINYRFPGVADPDALASDLIVANGIIDETALPSGFRFTHSDLTVFHSYESVSLGHAPLLIVIVLEGQVRLSIGAVQRGLQSGMAASLQLRPEYALEAHQPAGQRLKTVVLAFDPAEPVPAKLEQGSLRALLRGVHDPVALWEVPPFLLVALERSLCATLPTLQKTLVLEGLAMQLTGFGLPEQVQPPGRRSRTSSQQHQRLEAVRQLLEFAPAEEYSLDDLARTAAMSPSSLREKFRMTYGLSVFEYLRNCRLTLARNYLEQGYSVQQAAHRSGYRHATNFATAFRRQFGLSPKDIR
ncbi:AraC family transcriptional regulator [Marinobacter sp. ATCH36]|uniref:helix-turn-helix transcriptional regulator n=1 Tax=Marinobacter sp. ATCH36 TaxID=2945106 RepID=UPI0020202DEF|nr:AraC family transcriptional regulator [Marinobacter sp. ATCH36]MCL7942766.1 AraC family transcriptional regulator [Marinobacter sp. ATCH36]